MYLGQSEVDEQRGAPQAAVQRQPVASGGVAVLQLARVQQQAAQQTAGIAPGEREEDVAGARFEACRQGKPSAW